MAIAGAQRKQVLKVLMISLLLDLVRLTLPQAHPSSKANKQALDLLHLHPATLPLAAIFLSRARPFSFLPSQPHFSLPERLQERLCPPHRLAL